MGTGAVAARPPAGCCRCQPAREACWAAGCSLPYTSIHPPPAPASPAGHLHGHPRHRRVRSAAAPVLRRRLLPLWWAVVLAGVLAAPLWGCRRAAGATPACSGLQRPLCLQPAACECSCASRARLPGAASMAWAPANARPRASPAGRKNPGDSVSPSGALLKAVLLGGAATIGGFEADTGLPVDPPPSFRQGFGRVFLGGWAGGRAFALADCRVVSLGGPGVMAGCRCRPAAAACEERSLDCLLLSPPPPHTPAGNSVYLADTPGSRPLQVVDGVPINQGGCWPAAATAAAACVPRRAAAWGGWRRLLAGAWRCVATAAAARCRRCPAGRTPQGRPTPTASAPTAAPSPSPSCGQTTPPPPWVR